MRGCPSAPQEPAAPVCSWSWSFEAPVEGMLQAATTNSVAQGMLKRISEPCLRQEKPG